MLAAAGGAAVVAFAVAACSASPGSPATSATSTVSSAPSAASSPPAAGAAGSGFAESCTTMPLKSQLTAAIRAGASVIVAAGAPTGKSVPGNQAPGLYALALRSVRTLRGPAVTSGSTAWSPGPAHGTPATPVNSELLAPGGRLFAIVWPKAATHDLAGPTLQLAPIVGADVVFTPYGCWDLTGLAPGQYQASSPLRPVPGGANFGGARQAAENGLYTVPLATVEKIAASA